MTDIEKVFDAIRSCITVPKCRDCPWDECKKFDCLKVNVPVSLMLDALKLLKEQEARVMTLEELKQFEGSPCWFESRGTYMGKEGFWIIPYMFTCYQTMYYVFPLLSANERGDTHYSELGLSAYNKAWRCWTAKPTDKQRKTVKWDD